MAAQHQGTPQSPFTADPDAAVSAAGEAGVIERIREWLGDACPATPAGIGDDCAVLPPAGPDPALLTTDSLTYGQHFDDSVPAGGAGRKLVNRNLSDIAAMGGTPGPALFSLLCGPDLELAWLGQFVQGMARACTAHGVQLVGGDVSELPPGHFSAVLALTGTAARPMTRHGARPGDALYVTGELGGSRLGRHYRFEPRLAQGAWFAAQPSCTAMMDLTDGLAKDLFALLPPGCAAAIDPASVPVSPDAVAQARTSGQAAIEHAFRDGEDYELLVAGAPETGSGALAAAFAGAFPDLRLTRIGTIVEAPGDGPRLVDAAGGEPLPWQHGFEHFTASGR